MKPTQADRAAGALLGTEGGDALGEATRPVYEQWRAGALPADVDLLRAALFLQVRAHRHGGYQPFTASPYVLALVARIRELSEATVPVRKG